MIASILLGLSCLFCLFYSIPASAYPAGPFYYMGDGEIRIGKGHKGRLTQIRFREGGGDYNTEGLKKLNELYGTNWPEVEQRMSLRLIELLDCLEDNFKGRGIHIISGYRSPDYNRSLRRRGNLAASSSLHMDAEAIDIIMDGVSSSDINAYLIPKGCCGVGYYHGKAIHIDTGPPRFWDEKTSGTEKEEPPENEHITLKTKSDIYSKGDRIGVKFSRVTDYPIGVMGDMELICSSSGGGDLQNPSSAKEKVISVSPQFQQTVRSPDRRCFVLKDRREGRRIIIPTNRVKFRGEGARCRLRAYFCEPRTAKMPASVDSNEFILTF